MSSSEKNLSSDNFQENLDLKGRSVVVIVAQWNEEITESLYSGAVETLLKAGIPQENIIKDEVPGSFELSYRAAVHADDPDVAGIICLGCIIKGETKHDEYIAHAVAGGITQVSIDTLKPIIFGVLTPNNKQQAIDRAGGKHGNKGDEAAYTLLSLLNKEYN